jgi:hypothetical protein
LPLRDDDFEGKSRSTRRPRALDGEALMKKASILLLVLFAVALLAQEKSTITVKEATVATGVVIMTADLNGKSVDLQCTQSMPLCTTLKNGKYVMVQLPKNHGMYDCQNVDVFPADTQDPETGKKIGEYCLMQK